MPQPPSFIPAPRKISEKPKSAAGDPNSARNFIAVVFN
jgi:hypothetical protein